MWLVKRAFWLTYWLVVLMGLALVAIAIASKLALPLVDRYRPQIEQNLSQLTGLPVHIQNVSVELNGIDIKLSASDISIDTPQQPSALAIRSLEFELNLVRTLFMFSPQFQDFVVSGVKVALQENGKGEFSLAGQELTSSTSDNTDIAISRLLNYITEQRQISIVNANISVASPRFERQSISLPHSYLFQEHSKTLLSSDVYINNLREPVGVRVEIESSLTSFLQKYVNVYVQVPNIEIPTNWLDIEALSNVKSVSAAGEYWISYRSGSNFEIQSRNSELGVLFKDGVQFDMDADWRVRNKGDISSFNIARLDLGEGALKTDYPIQIKGEFDQQAQRSFIAYNHFDAKKVSEFALKFLPDDGYVARLIAGLSPSGSVENGSVRIWTADEGTRFQVGTNFSNVSIQSFNGIPAVRDVNGVFTLTESGGGVEFDAVDTELGFPALYDEAWSIDEVSGEVFWRRLQDTFVVTGEQLTVKKADSNIVGSFRLEQPDEASGWLALDLNAKNVATADRLTYVPSSALSEGLRSWLDGSLSGGQARNVDVLLRASLDQSQPPLVRLNVDADVDQVTFDRNWPAARNVSANVYMGQSEVSVNVKKGQFAGLPVKSLAIEVPLTSNGAGWLNLSGDISDNASNVLEALSQTPLQDQVLSPFEQWKIEGDIAAQFEVYVPLSDSAKEPVVDVKLQFLDNDLYIPEINLDSRVRSGNLSYTTKAGLEGSVFEVDALGGQSQIVLTSERMEDGRFIVGGEVTGEVSSKTLAQWRSVPDAIIERLGGRVGYQAEFGINRSQNGQIDLEVESDLKGLTSMLPSPFMKTEEASAPFELSLKVFQSETLLAFDVEKMLYGTLLLKDAEIQSGRFSLFDKLAPEASMQQGVSFSGQLQGFNWMDWSLVIDDLAGANERESEGSVSLMLPDWIRSVDLLVDEVDINTENQLHNMKLVYSRNQDGSPLTLTSDELNFVLRDAATLPDLHIAYLNWRTGSSEEAKEPSDKAVIQPNIIPSMNVRLDQLIIDNRPYGDWRAKVVNLGENVRIEDISTNLQHGVLSGEVFWQGGDNQNVEASIVASGTDTRELTRKFSPTPFIQSKAYDLTVALSWSGSVFEFDRETLNGRIRFNVENGNFNQVDQLPPFLKVLGIFNVDTLLKRLTFDFSDLYEEGMSFDTFSSYLVITEGRLDTEEPLEIKAPTAEIRLTGTADLVNEVLDERLTATIPISSTLPVAGLLLATPQVAGLLYITDKLIGDQISKVTSIQYEIKGPFTSPEVTPVKYNPRR